jgi:coenzyme F420-reducing hydrogenase alpha subunit
VERLARVEGEGAMIVDIDGTEVRDVQLRIYEPPRFFEAFLVGRAYTEPVDITARICGICPVAYQMSACLALEDACGVRVEGPLHELRRLLYCGEWIESHTLHVHLLHAPDFLGFEGAIDLAQAHRPEVERGLELKKIGNEIIEVIGGRAIHPVNVRLGGFYRLPSRQERRALRERVLLAVDLATEVVAWVGGFDFPELEHDHEFVALVGFDHYGVMDGQVISDRGLDVDAAGFGAAIAEEQVPHSTALHSRLLDRGNYLLGPMARLALGYDSLLPPAWEAAHAVGLGPDTRNPFRSIVTRAVEVLQACVEAVTILDGWEDPDAPAVPVEPRAGEGHGVSEAPRGLLYHRYVLDDDGTILEAQITPPTSQNQATIEHDLFHLVERSLDLDDLSLQHLAEQAIRNYDPCISCATHFLDMEVHRR